MYLRAGPELLRTVAWGTRVGLEPGRFMPLPRDFRGWPILALELLNRDFSEWRRIGQAHPKQSANDLG